MKNHKCSDCAASQLYDFLQREKYYIKIEKGEYNPKYLYWDNLAELWVIKIVKKIIFKTKFLDLALDKLKEDKDEYTKNNR